MNAINRLAEFNIKPSVQRISIMKYLLTHATHPTVDEIYTQLSPFMPTLSKTTVYNTLKLFSDCGAIQALTIDEKNICFDGNTEVHSHFLCKQCSRIYDFECHVSTKDLKALRQTGHHVSETHYYYKGICKDCLNEI